MKRIFLTILAAFALVPSFAQISIENEEASQKYSQRYDLLVSKLGPSGVGIETLLNNWEKVDPDNKKQILARYSYYFHKARTTNVIPRREKKYLGNDPVFTLKDSTGAEIGYFEDCVYDDSLFSLAIKNVDKAAKLYPLDLEIRFSKAAALISYEKESPDMALACLAGIADDYCTAPDRPWKFGEDAIDRESFTGIMQEYCYEFYTIGSRDSYDAFKSLSEKMVSRMPGSTMFLSNLGSYYLVAANDPKTALKYYNKVLKINPGDYIAARNCVTLSRRQKNVKLEKKYLPILIECTADEKEKKAAQLRLEALNLK